MIMIGIGGMALLPSFLALPMPAQHAVIVLGSFL